MLQGWARDFPGRIESLATALKNVVPSHLSDQRLFDFIGLDQVGFSGEGDTAFDPPSLPQAAPTTLQVLNAPGGIKLTTDAA